MKKSVVCIACGMQDLDRDTQGINRKLLGEKVKRYYCMECLANYLDTTVDNLKDKIEEFKEEGCKLFS